MQSTAGAARSLHTHLHFTAPLLCPALSSLPPVCDAQPGNPARQYGLPSPPTTFLPGNFSTLLTHSHFTNQVRRVVENSAE